MVALSPGWESASLQRNVMVASHEAVRTWITYAILVGFWAYRVVLVNSVVGWCKPASLQNDWTAVASRDIFLETSRITKASQTLAFFYCLTTASVLLLTNCINVKSEIWRQETHAPLSDDADASLRGDEDGTLWAFFAFDSACRILSLCFNGFMMSITMLIPASLYSAVTWEAVKVTDDHRLRAILRTHCYAFPGILCGLAQLALYTRRAMTSSPMGTGEFTACIILNVCLVTYQVAVSMWLVLRCPCPREVLRWWHDLFARFDKAVFQKKKSIVSRLSNLSMKDFRQVQGRESMTEVSGVMKTRDAGTELRRKLLLIFALISLSFSSFSSSYFQTAAVFLYRVFLMVLLLLTKDEVVSEFQQLRRGNSVGFGLVVDAAHLKSALRNHIAGKEYHGPLGKYKASIYRMIHTMAVSYRWQEGETHIGQGLYLNMSDWQLKSLLAALEGNPIQYVWIDRCAAVLIHAECLGSCNSCPLSAIWKKDRREGAGQLAGKRSGLSRKGRKATKASSSSRPTQQTIRKAMPGEGTDTHSSVLEHAG